VHHRRATRPPPQPPIPASVPALFLVVLLLAPAAPAQEAPLPAERFLGTLAAGDPAGPLARLRGETWQYEVPTPPEVALPSAADFAVSAPPGLDVRAEPAVATLAAPDGFLSATFEAGAGPRRLDPASGRPLAEGAPDGASCATGAEPDCQLPGQAPAANEALFDLLCASTRGTSPLDPAACALDVFGSEEDLIVRFTFAGTVAQLLSAVMAGGPQAIGVLTDPTLAGPGGRIPVVSLSLDAADVAKNGAVASGGPSGFFAPGALNPAADFALGGFPGNHNQFQTLAQVLTPEQQALVGCGPFLGTACDGGSNQATSASAPGGLGLLQSEAAALLQSFAPAGDPEFRTDDATVAQPGTAGAAAPACLRSVGATPVGIAGCRAPGEPGFSAQDGPDPSGVSMGFPAGIGPVPALGSPVLGPVAHVQGHPFTGQAWRSELAALSWNLQMLLVAFNVRVGTPGADPATSFDGNAPYRTDGCSYVKPQRCLLVRQFAAEAARLAPGDPTGVPTLRWLWARGRLYRVASASGRFAGYRGGWLVDGSLVEPWDARAPAPALGQALFAPEGDDADGDGVPNADDVCASAPDPGQEDGDGDGVGDACDDCLGLANADQRDTDGDGFGNACDADLDGNRIVNFGDVARLRAVFFSADPDGDLDGNGFVNFGDVARMRAAFFRPPGPSALAP